MHNVPQGFRSISSNIVALKVTPLDMEDMKAFSSMVEEDLENGSINATNNGGSDSQQENVGAVDDISERTFSFSQIYQPTPNKPKVYTAAQTLLLAYQSIGVVYGDLGTSPTQVLSSIIITNLSEDDLLGILSLIIWSLTSFILIKYVFIVLHADDHGEGGTFALYSSLCRHLNLQSKLGIDKITRVEPNSNNTTSATGAGSLQSKTRNLIEKSSAAQSLLTFVVLLGTCMVIGDGALTPATCVLSALQGIQSRSSKITQDHVVFMAVVLFVVLFSFQRCGTSKVSFLFSPIMVTWYVSNVSIGIYNILTYQPTVLKAISPHYIFKLFLNSWTITWHVLGAVFLCITGAEALFADMGHFNKLAIQLGFSVIVYPAMVFTYAGEIAYLIKNPDKISNAYYSSIPDPIYWPMFVISTLAAIVASQSMISATFSIIKQSIALNCFPRVKIVHTSSKHEGQVYSPELNYVLMTICVALVISFRGGVQLANAYGVVVIFVMIITTCLTALVMLIIWEINVLLVLGFLLFYMVTEVVFMTALLNKIPQGGWVPFAISAVLLTVMLSWRYGQKKKSNYETERKMSLEELQKMLTSGTVHRTPGICFFCTNLVNGIPPIIRHYIQHMNSVQEIMVIVTVKALPIKSVLPEERVNVGKMGQEGIYTCLVKFGYKDSPSMEGDDYIVSILDKLGEHAETQYEKQTIDSAAQKGVVFVTSQTILKANQNNGWIDRFTTDHLYRFLHMNCRSAISMLQVPPEKTLQVGMLYEI